MLEQDFYEFGYRIQKDVYQEYVNDIMDFLCLCSFNYYLEDERCIVEFKAVDESIGDDFEKFMDRLSNKGWRYV